MTELQETQEQLEALLQEHEALAVASRAMLAALKRMDIVLSAVNWHRGKGDAIEELQAAIAQAEAAGIE